MPLHPTLQMMTENSRATGRGGLRNGTLEEARTGYDAIAAAGGDLPELAGTDDRTIPGPAGEIPIRVYTPLGDGPFPILVWYHGGGFTIGSLDSHDPICRQLCAQAECLVVSVDYRLAPEHRFPAAVDDAFAALQWIGAHGAEIGGDPGRIAVSGDSAGGNLSTVASIMARDAGGPAVCFQALIYPTTDARADYPSVRDNGDNAFLSNDTMLWFYEHYHGDTDSKLDWRASPILTEDLSDLPPALIITAEFDTLRDEGEAYGEALREAGNAVTVRRYDGMTHVFVQLAGLLEDGRSAIAEVAAALRVAYAS